MLTRTSPASFAVLIAVVSIGLAAYTLAVMAVPGMPVAAEAPVMEVVVALAGTVLAGAIVMGAWTAHTSLGASYALAMSAGFLVLTVANGGRVVTELAHVVGAAASSQDGLARAWGSDLGRTAGLLVLGLGLPALAGRSTGPRASLGVLLLPGAATLAATVAIALGTRWLPALTAPSGGLTAIGFALHGAAVGAGIVALAGARLSGAATAGRFGRYLTTSLVLAAFAQVHYAFVPDAGLAVASVADALMAGACGLAALAVAAHARDAGERLRSAPRAGDVSSAVQAERARLAREVHDGLAQDLWRARLSLEAVHRATSLEDARRSAAEVTELLAATLADARQSISALRGPAGDEDLTTVLERQARAFTAASGVPVELDLHGGARIPSAASAELSRIVGEAFANIHKHADATLVRVDARVEGSRMEMRITDNGVGFDTTAGVAARGDGTRVGLAGMRERALEAGGEVRVESAPYAGTTVVINIPVAAA